MAEVAPAQAAFGDRVTVVRVRAAAHVVVGGGTRRNALRREDWTALREAFGLLAAEPDVRCVTVRGRGSHFCSGSDLSSWATAEQAAVHDTFTEMEAVFRAVEDAPMPVVAVVDGAAAGAGCQLALACDLRVLADRASIGMPTAALGIRPSPAFAARLVALTGPGRARELLYTGRMVPAAEAVASGLAEFSASPEELDRTVSDLVAAIVERPAEVIAASKQAVASLLPVSTDRVRAAPAPTTVHPVMRQALARYAE